MRLLENMPPKRKLNCNAKAQYSGKEVLSILGLNDSDDENFVKDDDDREAPMSSDDDDSEETTSVSDLFIYYIPDR